MSRRERQLEKMLAEMALGHEERKRRAQAAKLRRAERGVGEVNDEPELPRLAREDWDEYEELETGPVRQRSGRGRPASGPLVGSPSRPVEVAADGARSHRVGIVLHVAQGLAHVDLDGEERLCRVGAAVAVRQQSALAVGDEVELEDRAGTLVLVAVRERRSRLARRDPHEPERERVIAANVDLVVVVEPAPLRTGLVDRLLLAVGSGGAQPLVVASKADLLDGRGRAELELQRATYGVLEVPVLPCSTKTGDGLAALRAALAGKLAVLVGQSGVGKSSLLNALDPALALATSSVRDYDGKGRHTTSASRLYRLAGGARIIDTPGVRQFGLWQIDPEDVLVRFPEIARLAAGCRFRDCEHGQEPGCAVRQAVGGAVTTERLVAFRRLLATTREPGE